MSFTTLLIVLICLAFSAFFSGMEIAFVSANKLKFEMDKKERSITSSILNSFFCNPQQFISTILVGNNVSLVIYGLQMAILLAIPLSTISTNGAFMTISQTIISTAIVLFTSEFLPKSIFRLNPNLWLRVFAVPLWFCYIILYPISKFMSLLSVLILRLFGVKNQNKGIRQLSRTDLNYWFQENIDHIDKNEEIDPEVKIFRNALDFSSVKLKDCMIPRNEVVSLSDEASLADLKEKFIETGLSKIVVFHESIDNIIGYIHSSEMFKITDNWTSHVNPMPFAPETMPANKLLETLMKQKRSIAVVVDEFGGTAGIITLEDVMEEIVGEIEDEHDNNRLIYKKINDSEFVLSSRLEIDYVNQLYGLSIPESDEYVTIAGYILHQYQDFPKLNEVIDLDGFRFKILRVTDNKIELVNLRILKENEQE